jgi:hypothetical protein
VGRKVTTIDGRDYCVNGHEYTPENSRYNSQGYRYCVICTDASRRRTYAKQKLIRDKARAERGGRRKSLPLKTHCKRGHPFDEANVYVDRSGRRSCRSCTRNRARDRYQRGVLRSKQPRTSRQWYSSRSDC